MLPETPNSLKAALDLGISLYAGEAEGRFDEVLRDAAAGTLETDLQLPPTICRASKAQPVPICRPSGWGARSA